MITRQLFDRIFPTKGLDPRKYNLVRDRDLLISALNRILPKYGIDTYLRICAFFANCGIETDYFKTTVEYASGDAYDTKTSLGNTPQRDGDGRKYKGRGLTQTTGKYNYEQLNKSIGKQLGIDFVKNPELLAEVEIAVESACIFWRDHDLNSYADRGAFRELSGIVNRGDKMLVANHWVKRWELYTKLLKVIPKDLMLNEPTDSDLQSNEQVNKTQQLTPENPTDTRLVSNKQDDNFLADAFDKNVSPDDVRGFAREHSPKLIMRLARPIAGLCAALEAGNVYAWLGVIVALAFVLLEIYLYRRQIRNLWLKLAAKFTQ